MSGNQFGKLFSYTSWGESHGPAIGCVVDGVPPNISLCEKDIQTFLDQRKPGQSRFTTQRKEDDKVEILSGVFEGKTTGTPISLVIYNQDQRSKDYSDIKDKFRPGHADYTYFMKYGHRDYRGGGRSSARETACRVAAGAIARKVLETQLSENKPTIEAAVIQIGTERVPEIIWAERGQNLLWCPNQNMAKRWEDSIDSARKNCESLGALIEVRVQNMPTGLGEPVYDKLDADLAKAIMSINAVKAVEFGAGFEAVSKIGSQSLDHMNADEGGNVSFQSNHSGGILGGISSGQDLVLRFAVKPTSSLPQSIPTINKKKEAEDILTKGRHDPCVGIRAVPIAEAMVALVLADHWLRYKAQCL